MKFEILTLVCTLEYSAVWRRAVCLVSTSFSEEPATCVFCPDVKRIQVSR